MRWCPMIYIDEEFKCHCTNDDGTLRGFDVPFFRGKCQTFVEGYRYVPAGEQWVRSDGVCFSGEMIAPWKNYDDLADAQRDYERQQLAQYAEYLKILGVEA